MERKTVERLRPDINRVRALADRLNAEQREMRAMFDVLRSDLRNVDRRNSTSRIDDADAPPLRRVNQRTIRGHPSSANE